ncbi:MAG: MBL fold metallo-hydrolase [Actinomycetota bacterium]
MGTGLTYLGKDLLERDDIDTDAFRATMLVSHLHWDHIQGLPFFRPLLRPGAAVDLIGPPQEAGSLADAFAECISPPVFPVALTDLPGEITYRTLHEETTTIGPASVTAFPVRHVGPTNGYRIEAGTGSVVFICDHQQPEDGSLDVPVDVVDACRGADVLIHDTQYDAEEFVYRSNWGHCTPDFALELARQAGVKRLVMFHHDPSHDDQWIKDQRDRLQEMAGGDVEVLAAAEGTSMVSGA